MGEIAGDSPEEVSVKPLEVPGAYSCRRERRSHRVLSEFWSSLRPDPLPVLHRDPAGDPYDGRGQRDAEVLEQGAEFLGTAYDTGIGPEEFQEGEHEGDEREQEPQVVNVVAFLLRGVLVVEHVVDC